jgi:hypothetical protein
LICMGAGFDMNVRRGRAAGGSSARVPGKIVTGRHNEYTILADVSSPAGESTIQSWDAYPG